MQQNIISCDQSECFIVAEHFLDFFSEDGEVNNFDLVIMDLSKVYENAVLMGALGASKYIMPPVEPRVTFDVDVIIPKKDFDDFLNDEIPADKLEVLEKYFEDSDSPGHSLRHRKTRLYVDFVSEGSRPLSGRLLRRVFENPDESVNTLNFDGRKIGILRPELIIAMKLHRYAKDPRSEKALSDRLDIVKILKTYYGQPDILDTGAIRSELRRREIGYFDEMLADVACEMSASGQCLTGN